MHKLRFKEEGGRVLDLRPGDYLAGRLPDNDVAIDHPSISGTHCRITVDAAGLRVKDLGSTNGTFVEGRPVSESELLPGQTLKIGSVELWYDQAPEGKLALKKAQAHPPAPVEEKPSSSKSESADSTLTLARKPHPAADTTESIQTPPEKPCCHHAMKPALYACKQCKQLFCEECVLQRQSDARNRRYCHTCSGICLPLREFEEERNRLNEKSARLKTLSGSLADAFNYPLRMDGMMLLIGGTILFFLVKVGIMWAAMAGPFGIGALLLLPPLAGGYLAGYLRKIIQSSAQGDEGMPDWPDFSAWWDDIGCPLFHFTAVYLVSFGPAEIYYRTMEEPSFAIQGALIVFGLIYCPMALLAVTMHDTIVAVNPATVVLSIFRVPWPYLPACLVFWGIAMLLRIVPELVPMGLGLAGVTLSLTTLFVSLYLVTVEMRILGLLYHAHSRRLGWF